MFTGGARLMTSAGHHRQRCGSGMGGRYAFSYAVLVMAFLATTVRAQDPYPEAEQEPIVSGEDVPTGSVSSNGYMLTWQISNL